MVGAVVGGDGIRIAIIGGGGIHGREERKGGSIIVVHFFLTILVLAGSIAGNTRLPTGSSMAHSVK